MRFLIKLLAIVIVLAAVAAGAGYVALTRGLFEIPMAEMKAKYALPNSKYMDIDGIQVHYAEDGAKDLPTLVLIHASFMNLRSWDQLTKDLSSQFHIVRLDLLTFGLTGPDPKNEYSTERNLLIVDELTRRLGIEKFHILGTSPNMRTGLIVSSSSIAPGCRVPNSAIPTARAARPSANGSAAI